MIRPNVRLLGSCLASAASLFFIAASTASAGRFCAHSVEGGLASGETIEKAREAATNWWSSRAGALGKGYGDWQSAEEKDIKCETSPEGAAKCKAVGKPCLPDGVTPDNVPKFDL